MRSIFENGDEAFPPGIDPATEQALATLEVHLFSRSALASVSTRISQVTSDF